MILQNIHSLTPRHYNPRGVLADSRSPLQPSLSLALILQFLTPSLSASLITPSIHLRFGLPTHLLPSGLSKAIFLHGKLSCIRTIPSKHKETQTSKRASYPRRLETSVSTSHVASCRVPALIITRHRSPATCSATSYDSPLVTSALSRASACNIT